MGEPDPPVSRTETPTGISTEVAPEAEQRAQEMLQKHDSASRYRTNLGPWAWVIGALAIGLTVFQLYTALFGSRPTLIQGAIHVGAAMGLVFLLYPAGRRLNRRRGIPLYQVYDVVLGAAALALNLYIVVEYSRLTGLEVRFFGYSDTDHVVALLAILLILEGTRRCVGLPIVIIAVVALLYFAWGGNLRFLGSFAHSSPIPDFWSMSDQADQWGVVLAETFYTSRSVFGTPIRVSSTFIFLFLLFGVLLVRTNIGAFFNDLAFKATGRYVGGPAKAAVVASAMQGTVSGSSVANTVASGSFTIPLMKRAGFRPNFAAASEASASTGGQLMPPVMGAAAFIMAEYTGVPYREIIVLALIPALMYFTGVFLGIHFEAKRRRILGVARSELPPVRSLLVRADLLLPLVVIVGALLSGRTPANAALWGIVTAFVLSFLRASTRLSPMGMVRFLEEGARVALPVIAACATAGIVAGTVTATGIGGKLARSVVDLAETVTEFMSTLTGGLLDPDFGRFPLVLVFTMLACLMLGMGLPTTANYVVTATIAAPILLSTFDVPLIAAHLFVFYFGLLADVTPPVCLAAYAAAGIAGSNPMRSGVTALRLAVVGFIIPFIFVLQPALLLQDTNVLEVVPVVVTALLGMLAISAGLAGYLVRDAQPVERVLLVVAGIMLVHPSFLVSVPGLAVMVVIGAIQLLRDRRPEPVAEGP